MRSNNACNHDTQRKHPKEDANTYTCQARTLLKLNCFAIGFRGPIRFALYGFTYSWTLSSKFFSTFPHGTCWLSVFRIYLVLDGVYHPLKVALSSNPTLEKRHLTQRQTIRAYHPLWEKPSSRELMSNTNAKTSSFIRHIPLRVYHERFGDGLFPFRSQLLGKYLLVSFPPLNNMLKFSG